MLSELTCVICSFGLVLLDYIAASVLPFVGHSEQSVTEWWRISVMEEEEDKPIFTVTFSHYQQYSCLVKLLEFTHTHTHNRFTALCPGPG